MRVKKNEKLRKQALLLKLTNKTEIKIELTEYVIPQIFACPNVFKHGIIEYSRVLRTIFIAAVNVKP